MSESIPFTKASGAGNDFVLVNNMSGNLRTDFPALARASCDRHFGVGGDGLLVIQKSALADFMMLYFNADGSSGGMCGNGGRCIARFALMEGIAGKTQRFEALGHVYDAEVGETSVRLRMKDPSGFSSGLAFTIGRKTLRGAFLDTGAPHVVVFEEDLEGIDVAGLGRAIRNEPRFMPGGANVNFARVRDGSTVEIRTYERGVESETLACGTGSIASALVSADIQRLTSPVTVSVRSGEQLHVHFVRSTQGWSDVFLEGSAHILFQGTMLYHPGKSIIRLIP